MASISMAMPLNLKQSFNSKPILQPLAVRPSSMASSSTNSKPVGRLGVQASLKETAATGLTAAALSASMAMPDVAEAAVLTPSLNNFLLSIAAGGVVLGAIVGAIVAVSNFDPVKRS